MTKIPSSMSRKFGLDQLPPLTNATQIEDSPVPPLLSHESVSTASESTDSSPTTTNSTFDSPIMVETSPDSSPESPTSIIPLPTIKPSHEQGQADRTLPSFLQGMPSSINSASSELSSRRAKNLKNLSLRLPVSPFHPTLSTAPIAEGGRHLSEPSSPVRPHSRGSRRRPPNLTIQTPGFQRPYSSNGTTPAVPPTPSIRPSLRHIESSPSLNSILSPTQANPTFPTPFSLKPCSFSTVNPGKSVLPSNQTNFNPNEPLIEFREEDDCPISRESRKGSERGYPDGPIRIYDSGLYLYLEPNKEEASKFDVVFNVAKEVNNPFKGDGPKPDTVMSVWKATLAQSNAALREEEPVTACSELSFKSALESLSDESPLTPKASQSEPEYIHVPWDHNSEILEDLFPLCEIIDDRISRGKRVLIHCQLGVSRSASLVIAYGLYKNPHLDFNTVYGKVKERSCWVGPNMSLIYQLTDFRTRIRGGTIAKSPMAEPNGAATQSSPKQATDIRKEIALSKVAPVSVSGRATVDPSKLFAQVDPFNSVASSNRVRRGITPRPLPLREKFHTIHSLRKSPANGGLAAYPRPPLRPAFQMDLVMQDVPPSPSFFSPKATEFMATPFARTNAGDLALQKSIDLQSPTFLRRPSITDPRSPQKGTEPIIMRSIDEFL
ncbi:tyrosine/serine/threonine protein phosphatase [Emydomyces testavorans]|uniref:protein-tyrosine-phosphatase n=1 Tax=Emydomyces testavorans TaxID=2070801 RepID=A0AAF0IL59_9EURO|nr:tyrosine/serine/threonine protein phosphatase [Emydomyces testavorans]